MDHQEKLENLYCIINRDGGHAIDMHGDGIYEHTVGQVYKYIALADSAERWLRLMDLMPQVSGWPQEAERLRAELRLLGHDA